MNHIDTSQNYLTIPTGDPFCDIGGFVIDYLQGVHDENKNPEKLIAYITNFYIKSWKQKLHSFFHNSKLTHNSVMRDPDKAFEANTKFYQSLYQGQDFVKEGYCRITGLKTLLFSATRMNSILTGADSMINFSHGFEDGLLLSKEALTRFLFVPFGAVQIGGRYAVVYSNREDVTKYFVEETCKHNLDRGTGKISKGVRRLKYANPSSALFYYADKCYYSDLKIVTVNPETGKSEIKGVTLNILHFTNFSSDADVQIYMLPAVVFQFYHQCISQFAQDWQKFVKANYVKFRGYRANFDSSSEDYTEAVKEATLIPVTDFKYLEENMSGLNLSVAGTKRVIDKKTKSEAEFIVVNKNEFETWKQGKPFKEWKESEEYKEAKTQTLKEEFKLTYQFEDYSTKWLNLVYDKLISGQSIRANILRWNETHSFDFRITKLYQILIRNMNEKTLEYIERIADVVIQDETGIKKSIRAIKVLEYGRLRSFIIKLIEKHWKEGNKESLITLRDYVKYLFPAGTAWTEIRDLLLICIYQKMHENNIVAPDDDEDDDNVLLELPDDETENN